METDKLRVRKKTLQSVLVQCQKALELFNDDDLDLNSRSQEGDVKEEQPEGPSHDSASDSGFETDELYDLLKSKVESPKFLEKLGSIHTSAPHCISEDDIASWNMISLWEDEHANGENELDQDSYVLVKQEDVVEGIACFMAAYLLSLQQAKELTPNQLQEALSKTFSVKKKRSKLQKAWDGSKVIYSVASWSATAVGIYQNPALCRAASAAFWTSCRVISKLL